MKSNIVILLLFILWFFIEWLSNSKNLNDINKFTFNYEWNLFSIYSVLTVILMIHWNNNKWNQKCNMKLDYE